MDLEKRIGDDMKAAMLARDSEKLEAIRAIKAAILLEKTKEGATGELQEEAGLKILQKLVKQRKESGDIYKNAGREDLAKKEFFEASIIETYLPRQLSEAEITARILQIIAETGAASIKEMGKVMGLATKEFAGRADNKLIAEIIRKNLAS